MVLGGFWPPGTLTSPFLALLGAPKEPNGDLGKMHYKPCFWPLFAFFNNCYDILVVFWVFLSCFMMGFCNILSINIAFLAPDYRFLCPFSRFWDPREAFWVAGQVYSQKIDLSGPKNDLPDLFYFLFPLLWRVFWCKNELNRSRIARVMTPTRFQNVRGP